MDNGEEINELLLFIFFLLSLFLCFFQNLTGEQECIERWKGQCKGI